MNDLEKLFKYMEETDRRGLILLVSDAFNLTFDASERFIDDKIKDMK